MDWEKFSFEYQLEVPPGIFQGLVAIEAQRIASTNLILAPDWQEQLDKLNRVRAVYGTTALEGNPLSEGEVSHQVEVLADPPEERITREQLQIRNAAFAQQ